MKHKKNKEWNSTGILKPLTADLAGKTHHKEIICGGVNMLKKGD